MKKLKLRYSIYDWDDNILHMPTLIHIDKFINNEWIPVDITSKEFVKIRKQEKNHWRRRENDVMKTYCELGDNGSRGNDAFLEDSINAIQNQKFGPSWNNFLNTLISGEIFLIVTSRSHEPDSIRRVIEWIIYNVFGSMEQHKMILNLMKFHDIFGGDYDNMVDSYLNSCEFVGVMSEYFKKKFNIELENSYYIEHSKQLVIDRFIKRIKKFANRVESTAEVSFSDDDIHTVKHITEFLKKEKTLDYINKDIIEYIVMDTSNHKEGIKETKI